MRGSTNKPPIKLSMQRKLNWHGDLFMNRENLYSKNPTRWFKVTTPDNPLLSQQAVTSKGISIPYTNLQLNLYPNTQLDLFCSDNLSFQCMAPSTWLTNCADPNKWLNHQLEKECWLQSSSVHHTMKIKKLLSHKTLQCTNTAASSRERWTRANSVFGHNLHKTKFCFTLVQLV